MRHTTSKNGDRWNTSHCFLLLLLSFLISCKGQDNSQLSANAPIQLNKTATEVKLNGSQSDNQTITDPLFFIDGQLCQHVRKIFQDSKGNLWFGTNVYDLMFYNGDTLKYFNEKDGFGGGRITGIVEDNNGNVWIGSAGGLSKYDVSAEQAGGNAFTHFTENDGLLNNEIWCLIIDKNGIFWIGTNSGVSRFDGEEFTTFSVPKAQVKDTTTVYAYDRITGIVEDKYGYLWFGTDGFGITKYDPKAEQVGGKVFTTFTKENGLPDNTIHELMADSKGNIWIGTYFGGLSKYDVSAEQEGGNKFTNFTEDGMIEGVEVAGFYEDKKGDIWFAVENNGVYRYDGKSFVNFNKEEGLVTNGILSIYEDREGRFWFGGWGGLFRYDGKSFAPVTKEGPWGI